MAVAIRRRYSGIYLKYLGDDAILGWDCEMVKHVLPTGCMTIRGARPLKFNKVARAFR